MPQPAEAQDTARAPWRSLVERSLPTPLRAVSAFDAARAVVIASDRAYQLDGDTLSPLCDDEHLDGDVVLSVAARTSDALLLGVRDRRPVLWRARGDSRCDELTLPGLTDAPEALSLDRAGERIWLRSSAGALWQTNDAGDTWTELPRLSRVTRVFAGPTGETWATTSAGVTNNLRDGAAHRGRIVRLSLAPSPSWAPVAEDRLLPAASSARADGTWLIADGLELSSASPGARLLRERWLPWSRTRADAPSEIVDAGGGRFFASSGRLLFRVDDEGVQPLGTLPGGGGVLRIDAARDGALWAIDEQTVWQADPDARWRDRTRRPWSAASLTAARLRGEHCAVATDDGRVVIRDAATGRWVTHEVARARGRAVALAINASGAVLALCERGAAMGDARGVSMLDAPTQRGGMDETPSAHAIGDRWVLLRGGVWTSDDEGASWQPRLANGGEGAGPTRPLSNLVVARGRALALDEGFNLWRSDDGAASWRRLSTDPPWPGAEPPRWNSGRPVLAWDGEQRVALIARSVLAFSEDGGRRWQSRALGAIATSAALRPDGGLYVAVGHSGGSNRLCDGARGIALLGGRPDSLGLVTEACDRLGDAVYLDGERGEALLVRREGMAWLGSLDALRDPTSARVR